MADRVLHNGHDTDQEAQYHALVESGNHPTADGEVALLREVFGEEVDGVFGGDTDGDS